MAITLTPLFTMTAELESPLVVGPGPAGNRMIFEVVSGSIEGDRIRGTLRGGSSADWLTMDAAGIGTLDVRALVETDGGALVFVQYQGRADFSVGLDQPIRIAPRFETSAPAYTWLNAVQAVGVGRLDGSTLTYEVAAVD